jgi:hypothetical protein
MNSSPQGPQLIGRLIASVGATLLALVFAGTSVVALIWALTTLLGLPKLFLWVLLALGAVPMLWAVLWTAQRAWHVEQLLEQGRDIDQPVFKLNTFWRKKAPGVESAG